MNFLNNKKVKYANKEATLLINECISIHSRPRPKPMPRFLSASWSNTVLEDPIPDMDL